MAPKLSYLYVSFLLFLIQLLTVQSRTLKSNDQSFKFLQNLEGSQKGQTVQRLNELKQYLKMFGYYPKDRNDHINLTDDFDDILENALKTYQKYFGLKITGYLDSDTIREITTPRCGVPDQPTGETEHANKSSKFYMVSHYSYFPGMQRWPSSQTVLTYTFRSAVQVIDMQELRTACFNAFQKWAGVTQFTFQEASEGAQADIVIGFRRGDHGDGYPFDGPGRILAHSFAPTDGRFHIDADENWSTNPGMYEMDLESVAVHEIGHLLGLGHSRDPNAIMYPTISAATIKRELGQDDIDGIRSLYAYN